MCALYQYERLEHFLRQVYLALSQMKNSQSDAIQSDFTRNQYKTSIVFLSSNFMLSPSAHRMIPSKGVI